jgi:hypothetical protein
MSFQLTIYLYSTEKPKIVPIIANHVWGHHWKPIAERENLYLIQDIFSIGYAIVENEEDRHAKALERLPKLEAELTLFRELVMNESSLDEGLGIWYATIIERVLDETSYIKENIHNIEKSYIF